MTDRKEYLQPALVARIRINCPQLSFVMVQNLGPIFQSSKGYLRDTPANSVVLVVITE